jgi:Na+-transporting methylmalonyl-CoA/oxaloacetate decarboxylase gamma subunit
MGRSKGPAAARQTPNTGYRSRKIGWPGNDPVARTLQTPAANHHGATGLHHLSVKETPMKLTRVIFLALAFLIPSVATMAKAEDKPAAAEAPAAADAKKAKKSKKGAKKEGEEKKEEAAPAPADKK